MKKEETYFLECGITFKVETIRSGIGVPKKTLSIQILSDYAGLEFNSKEEINDFCRLINAKSIDLWGD